jgi:hypothetical protein
VIEVATVQLGVREGLKPDGFERCAGWGAMVVDSEDMDAINFKFALVVFVASVVSNHSLQLFPKRWALVYIYLSLRTSKI